eukprot:c37105_g1_i1 orf=45-203(+)
MSGVYCWRDPFALVDSPGICFFNHLVRLGMKIQSARLGGVPTVALEASRIGR